jgi:hypothetical protein
MEIYCLLEFKKVYEKLLKNNSYSNLTQEIISCFHQKNFSDCLTGRNLSQLAVSPYLKKDIGGRSGYRLYYLALTKNEKIYFGFIHPKTGSEGSSNTKDDYRKELIKSILDAIENQDILKVVITKKTIMFKKLDEE